MAANGKRLGFLPGWRIFTYFILAFNTLMLIWVIAGASTASGQPKHCHHLGAKLCNDASDAGTAIGVSILIFFWVAGAVILGILWLVTNRKKTRDCPACGTDVKKGVFACQRCGFDFRSTAYGNVPLAPAGSHTPVYPQQGYAPQQPYPTAQPPAPVAQQPVIRIPEQTPAMRTPTNAEMRTWAREQGLQVSDKGRVPVAVVDAFYESNA